jgi:hypothetical protein
MTSLTYKHITWLNRKLSNMTELHTSVMA